MRLLLFFLLSIQTFACQVPVFRYALERWQADPFRLQIISNGPPPALSEIPAHLNLEFESLDLTQLTPAQQFSIVGLDQITEYPAFLLHPPESWTNPAALVFPASESSLKNILDSPLRQRIKNDLLAGESTVWVLIEGSNEVANEATFQQLEETLEKAQAQIKIPEGVIQANQVGKVGDDISLDDVLRSTIPLKISFKIERIKRHTPAEQAFLRILTANRPSPPEEPLVVPIFGRGRTPGPLLGSSITPEAILTACEYLCGACSCQVKSGNPGYDLLFQANWQEKLQSGLVVIDKELPAVLPTLNDKIPSEPTTAQLHNSDSFSPAPIAIIGIIILALITGTIFLLKRSS
ncbi:MAG: hypothetical protein OSB05_03145 [Akkermansiaceae bacterium]|nr:hypothetical protein [Akkermansiaceae bacterium]